MARMFSQYKDDGFDTGFVGRLDNILYFLAGDVLYRDKVAPNKGWSIREICDIWNIKIMPGDEKTLLAKLITDGYVEILDPSSPEIIHITNKGLDFIDEKGYMGVHIEEYEEYKRKEEKDSIERELNLSTIRSHRQTFWISMVSLAISIIAIIISLFQ